MVGLIEEMDGEKVRRAWEELVRKRLRGKQRIRW